MVEEQWGKFVKLRNSLPTVPYQQNATESDIEIIGEAKKKNQQKQEKQEGQEEQEEQKEQEEQEKQIEIKTEKIIQIESNNETIPPKKDEALSISVNSKPKNEESKDDSKSSSFNKSKTKANQKQKETKSSSVGKNGIRAGFFSRNADSRPSNQTNSNLPKKRKRQSSSSSNAKSSGSDEHVKEPANKKAKVDNVVIAREQLN